MQLPTLQCGYFDSNEEQCCYFMLHDRQQQTKVAGSNMMNMVALADEEQRTKRALSLGQSQSAGLATLPLALAGIGSRAHANSNLQSFIHPHTHVAKIPPNLKYSTNLDMHPSSSSGF